MFLMCVMFVMLVMFVMFVMFVMHVMFVMFVMFLMFVMLVMFVMFVMFPFESAFYNIFLIPGQGQPNRRNNVAQSESFFCFYFRCPYWYILYYCLSLPAVAMAPARSYFCMGGLMSLPLHFSSGASSPRTCP